MDAQRAVCVAILASSIIAVPRAGAADRTWVGRSFFNDNWGDSANWDLFAWPDHGDTPLFTFHGGTRTTPFVDYGVTLAGLRFIDFGAELPAPSYTINGGSRILTMSGPIYNEGRNPQRVNAPIRIAAGGSFRNDMTISGLLTIGGTVDTAGNALNAYVGTRGMSILGPISGTGSLIKRGIGILELRANNTYTGDTNVTSGILSLGGNGRLSAATDLVLSDTGHFQMFGIAQTVNTLVGAGSVRGGTLIVGTGGSYDGDLELDALVKRGTFALALSNADIDVGRATIEQGALQLIGSGRLDETTELSILSEGTLDLQGGFRSSVRSLNGTGRIRLTGTSLTIWPLTNTASSFGGTIDGDGGLTKEGDGLVALSGTSSYSGPTRIMAGTFSVTASAVSPASDLVVAPSGLYLMDGSAGTYAPRTLEVQHGGAARVAAGGDKVLRTGNVSIYGTGSLDLTDNQLVLGAGTAADLGAITALIASARNAPAGRWKGPGITSSAAAADPLTTLAVGLVADEVLVKYTYNGDANLDGRINADDYFRIDSGFLAQVQIPTYRDGNFNYDGRINADDYFLIDSAFLGQGAPLSSLGATAASVMVPEPGLLTMTLSVAGYAALRRRSRRA